MTGLLFKNMLDFLNTREKATAVWLTIFFIWALSDSNVRCSILDLLKIFFNKKIFTLWIAMLAYIALGVLGLKNVGLWDISISKDTILWILGPAFASFVNINRSTLGNSYFKEAIFDNLKLVAVLEFILNLYTFSFPVELFLVPFISFVAALEIFAGTRAEYRQVNKFLKFVLVLVGFFLLTFSIRYIVFNMQNFLTFENLRSFLLPLILSIILVPYIYIMALVMQYEILFVRINIANDNSKFARHAKMKVLTHCHINLSKLTKVARNARYPKINEKKDVLQWFQKVNL